MHGLRRLRQPKTVNDLERQIRFSRLVDRVNELRSRVQVAVVDDEGFGWLNELRNNQFNLTPYRDVQLLTVLQPYPIILCDLLGVGRSLDPRLEGAKIIIETKRIYPDKLVIGYSATTRRSKKLEESMKISDYFMRRTDGPEEWTAMLDKAIVEVICPIQQWRRLQKRLFNTGIPARELADIEDVFVRCVERDEDFTFEKVLEATRNPIPHAAQLILKEAVSHITFELAKTAVLGR